MIHTYSVIIQNQKTIDVFQRYQPLFADAINNNRIGVCKWIESGTTIDTALPELRNMTDDKDDWRAVIVRYIDDSSMASFDTDERNPYDFCINKDSDELSGISEIPLVRLTQMLGGLPPYEVKFEAKVIKDREHKTSRTIYKPIEDRERENAYKELVRKYKFDGKMPSSILIISIRNNTHLDDDIVGRDWSLHKESDSSEFWKRNHYPSMCRFTVVDFTEQGPIQKDADEFAFWYAVMLMSVNSWDFGGIQAYRLYSLRVKMDKKLMEDDFQILVNKLRDAKRVLEKSIKQDIEKEIDNSEELPDYRLDVSVPIKDQSEREHTISTKLFGLFSRGASTDIANWVQERKIAEKGLSTAIKSAERTLDQTAERMRGVCTFSEDEVLPLNKYQEEDLEHETDVIYQDIIKIQGKLPSDNAAGDEKKEAAAEDVREYLKGRVMRKPAIIAWIISACLVLLSFIPAFIPEILERESDYLVLLIIFVVIILTIIISTLIVLIIQKVKINRKVETYNQLIKDEFNKITQSAGDYSNYMSSIASHSRGRSYLNYSTIMKRCTNTEHYSKVKHIKAINILLGRLATWSKAYHLNVDFMSKRPDISMEIDLSAAPIENKVYSFDTSARHAIDINNSGMTMETPFRFAHKIEIIREELYDGFNRK